MKVSKCTSTLETGSLFWGCFHNGWNWAWALCFLSRATPQVITTQSISHSCLVNYGLTIPLCFLCVELPTFTLSLSLPLCPVISALWETLAAIFPYMLCKAVVSQLSNAVTQMHAYLSQFQRESSLFNQYSDNILCMTLFDAEK